MASRRPTATKSRAQPASVLSSRPKAPLATTNGGPPPGDRLGVRKTYKLYIGGTFPRTESGRAYEVFSARGELLANACRGTRKDIRDAVRAARTALPGWSAKTGFNRSQILYRIAELMEGRRDQFISEVLAAEGIGRQRSTRLVNAAIDRWVWYAGWADKFSQVSGSVNPVNGSYFNFSVPEPTGVVGVIAPEGSSLLGLVSRLAPVIVSGNCAVVLASESRP
jgi:acyl-CoA reductase-like NAD-dependent aldehyde dehydrogenase